MAAVPTTLTLEQFRQLDLLRKPHLEFWLGEMFRKPVGTFLHGVLQSVLIQLFARHGLTAIPEVRVRLGGNVELVPDLIFIEHPPAGKYPTNAFELAVENSIAGTVPALADQESPLLHRTRGPARLGD